MKTDPGMKAANSLSTEEANGSAGGKVHSKRETLRRRKGTYKLTYSVDPDRRSKVEGPSSVTAGKMLCLL